VADEGAGKPAGGIRTFLIADVRGYTLFTQERGDEAAAKLAARFAGIAREVVDDHGGSVIELRGDEALAVFDSPRQAIRAATVLQLRFLEETEADPTLPLPVGIGLDAGEAVPLERGYRGGPSTSPPDSAAGRDRGRFWRVRVSSSSPARWRVSGSSTGGSCTSRDWTSRSASSE
jgi:class 3 adenylate cyclase